MTFLVARINIFHHLLYTKDAFRQAVVGWGLGQAGWGGVGHMRLKTACSAAVSHPVWATKPALSVCRVW